MRGLPQFSVDNPVLVNIVMIAMLLGGVTAAFSLVREMFPEDRPNAVAITAPYPGATPEEVEQGLALRIEEAVKDIENIDRIETEISEGLCLVVVEMTNDVEDIDQVVNDFKAAIDAIPQDELPEEAEEIRVAKSEPRLPVISVTLFGDVDEPTRKVLGEQLRDELLLLPEISDIALSGIRKAELTVAVQPEKLVEYGVSLAEVASAIREANLDLPAGRVKTVRQDVSVRTLGETDDVARISETVVRTTPSGKLVRVRDLAEVIDGFEDVDTLGRFNGKPAVSATIYKTGDQDAIHIAEVVQAFAAGKAHRPMEWDWLTRLKNGVGITTTPQEVYEQAFNDPYPTGVTLLTHSNLSRFIESRLELLTRNGFWGLLLVFLSLLLFLNGRVAFWVMMGLVLSVCGAIMLMSLLGATLNLISMFGLIVVLGLIVDDAIVVGENIYARVERGEHPHLAAVRGTQEVTWPVIVAVCTTIGAFLPLLFIEGRIGAFMGILPIVVTCALSVSLIEAFSILPSHLAETLKPKRKDTTVPVSRWGEIAATFSRFKKVYFQDALTGVYERFLILAVRYRYVTCAAALVCLLIAGGFVAGGRVPFVLIQKMDSETLMIDLDMPVGTPAARTQEALLSIEEACLAQEEVNTVWAIIGARINASQHGASTTVRSHLAQLVVELKPIEQRDRSSDEVIADLRAATANMSGVNSIRFRSLQGGPGGAELEIEVTGKEIEPLVAIAEQLQDTLAEYKGVYDIADDYEQGRPEVQVELLESARSLGITTRWLATEVRGAFYGLEARTLQRGREDVDIRVRFPEPRRGHVYELETMRVVTPTGTAIPFREAARLDETRGTAAIRRVDQRRAVVVSADVDQTQNNADKILADLAPLKTQLERDNPGVRISFTGNKREAAKSFSSLKRDFVIAIVIIYFMLAGLFQSYTQPLVVLLAVPFGVIGVIAGHWLMGYEITILSMIGTVALTGIVVNDALILVDFINKERAANHSMAEAVIAAGVRRLRPILLTSLTTILGLAPLMTETSFQARFLIPMAISINFGLAFATALTLVVVPANFMILHDVHTLWRRIWYGPRWREYVHEPGEEGVAARRESGSAP